MQYVWGQRYIDASVLHREDGDVNGTYDDTWYHMCDVQFSTVALLDSSGGLVERVTYDAYGDARHHYMADWDGDGGVTQAEINQIRTVTSGANHAIGESNYNPDMDINRDGDVARSDYTIANSEGTHSALAKGLLSDPSVDNQIGWDGYVFNAETRQYAVRFRSYDPVLGRWLERDLIGSMSHAIARSSGRASQADIRSQYNNGMGLYECVAGNPRAALDPFGTCFIYVRCCPVSDTVTGCSRNCKYRCTETRREQRTAADCDTIPANYVTYEYSSTTDWVCRFLEVCPWVEPEESNPPKCKDCYDQTKILMDTYWDFNCSNPDCKGDCDDIRDLALKGCDKIKVPAAQAICIATAEGVHQLCYMSCDAFCRGD
ncbi:MAG: RHS repeat-associated core domain-containing protein [Phycisphaerales bacterium]